MNEYKKGDKVWFVPAGAAFAVSCTIEYVEDCFRKKSPEAFLFYDLDEPIGHDVDESEITRSRKEALEALREQVEDEVYGKNLATDLNEWRDRCIRFIVKTHGKNWDTMTDEERKTFKYKKKTKGKDWIPYSKGRQGKCLD